MRAQLLTVAVFLLAAAPASAQLPQINVSPSGGTYYLNDVVNVTIEYCSPTGGGLFDAWPNDITFPGGYQNFQVTPGSRWDCDDFLTATASVTISQTGFNVLQASIVNMSGQGNGQATYIGDGPPPPPAPTVSDQPQVTIPGVFGASQAFTVVNNSTSAYTFDFSVICTGVVSNCSVSPASQLVISAVTVMVTYTASGAFNDTGTVRVTATIAGTSIADTGSMAVRMAPTEPVIARDNCLTIAVGPDAAAECGGLRIVHPLPAVTSLNRTRVPTLIYNSQHVRPQPVVDTVISVGATVDSVVASLSINSSPPQRRQWAGSQFPVGAPRRVGVAFNGANLATGVYPFTLEVRRYTGTDSSIVATRTGQVPIVNRDSSRFGAGWWLAGYEQISFPAAGQVLWVGGDGSLRRYVLASGNIYVATPVDYPDTLVKVPHGTPDSVRYVRLLAGGDSVVFNPLGLHVRTVNSLGHRTEFIDSAGRLVRIRMPPKPDSLTYTFVYGSANGRLTQVIAPDTAGGSGRITAISRSGVRIDSILDPGMTTRVRFAYGGSPNGNRIKSRRDRRGHVTQFLYNSANLLTEANLGLAAGDTIRHILTPAETRGLVSGDATLRHPDSVFTRYNGPRVAPDPSDLMTFWHGRFGSVRMIRDQLGYVSMIDRADARWPGLSTRIQSPGGRIARFVYDGRGNVATSTDSSTPGQPTTRYEWHTRTSRLTKVVPPMGDSTVISYDATGVRREWQQDASGSSSRVTFGYNARNQVIAALAPGGTVSDSLTLDSLGNVIRTRSPMGFQVLYQRDRIGRVNRVAEPNDSAQNGWRYEWTFYDGRGFDTLTERRGYTDTLRVRRWYDAEGNLDSLRRWPVPDSSLIGLPTTRWRYDPAGRAYEEEAPDGAIERRVFDHAGNLTRLIPRTGDTIQMSYDAADRLIRRFVPGVVRDSLGVGIAQVMLGPPENRRPYPWYPTDTVSRTLTIPADADTLAYDSAGNMVTAFNGAARIFRSYFPDGLIKRDSIEQYTYSGSGSPHRYVIRYDYDLNRRLTHLIHPSQLAPSGAAGTDTVRYLYNNRGFLSDAYDLQRNRFEFEYDARGRQTATRQNSGGIHQIRVYDADDRLYREIVTNTRNDVNQAANVHHYSLDSLRVRTLRYSDPQRVYRATNTKFWLDESVVGYTSLGQMGSNSYYMDDDFWSEEAFYMDALGNVRRNVTTSNLISRWWHQTSTAPRALRYHALSGRLRATSQNTGVNLRIDTLEYDAAGNQTASYTQSWGDNVPRNDRVSFYDPAGRLRVAETRSVIGSQGAEVWQVVFEEYRYDALGRRIMVRTRRLCDQPTDRGCWLATMRRTVWDGDHELWEIQAPGGDTPFDSARWEEDVARIDKAVNTQQQVEDFFDPNRHFGRVGYVHSGAIDQPLSATHLAYTDWQRTGSTYTKMEWQPFTRIPLWNWRGYNELTVWADSGANNDGNYRYCTTPQATRCLNNVFTPNNTSFGAMHYLQAPVPSHQFPFYGTLLDEKEDGAGTYYRRNRYLDPQTGRFTQEDPIGLAGGLNVYGFAAGDPITFSDPFGLCPGLLKVVCWIGKKIIAGSVAGSALDVAEPRVPGAGTPGSPRQGGDEADVMFERCLVRQRELNLPGSCADGVAQVLREPESAPQTQAPVGPAPTDNTRTKFRCDQNPRPATCPATSPSTNPNSIGPRRP